jgi:hypothetical protein
LVFFSFLYEFFTNLSALFLKKGGYKEPANELKVVNIKNTIRLSINSRILDNKNDKHKIDRCIIIKKNKEKQNFEPNKIHIRHNTIRKRFKNFINNFQPSNSLKICKRMWLYVCCNILLSIF